MSNDKICVFPWDSLAIRPNGEALPCAVYTVPHEYKIRNNIRDSDVRNNEDWKNLRTKIFNGETVPECYHCHRLENSGVNSVRTYRLQETEFRPTNIEPVKLNFLEMSFNNLCNLACVSCNAWHSTTWATEDHKHGRSNPDRPKILIESNGDLDKLDLSELRSLKIIGGEPFMDQNNFVKLMERLDLSKIGLVVSTNGTNFPNKRLEYLINQCNSVKLEVSIDGIGPVNEWYRWPTKMPQVESVMNYFQDQQTTNNRIELRTHSLINIFNIWTLDEFVIYLNDRYPNWNCTWDWIKSPHWQELCLIPEPHKSMLKEKLQHWYKTIPARPEPVNLFKISMDRLDDIPRSTLEEFKKRTLELEKERGLNVKEMVPGIGLLLD